MFITIRIRKKGARMALSAFLIALFIILMSGLVRTVETAAKPQDGIALPVIMYHSLSKNSQKQGRYVISPSVVESDLKYLKEHGYTTVLMKDILAYVDEGKPLPEHPIMLTFDDGNYNNYLYALPLMEQYDSYMVLSPIGFAVDQYTENGNTDPSYASCNWETLKKMVETGRVEIQNHTYNMHHLSSRKGASRMASESISEYQEALKADLIKMQDAMKAHLGEAATTFVYPFGAVSKESVPLLKEMGFRATMICTEKINYITRDPASLYGIGRYIRTGSPSSERFFQKILSENNT